MPAGAGTRATVVCLLLATPSLLTLASSLCPLSRWGCWWKRFWKEHSPLKLDIYVMKFFTTTIDWPRKMFLQTTVSNSKNFLREGSNSLYIRKNYFNSIIFTVLTHTFHIGCNLCFNDHQLVKSDIYSNIFRSRSSDWSIRSGGKYAQMKLIRNVEIRAESRFGKSSRFGWISLLI